MKNTKRPLRAVLDDLTTAFVDAVLAAARDALTDSESFFHAGVRSRGEAKPGAVRRAPPQPRSAKRADGPKVASPEPRWERPPAAEAPVAEASTELLITDPQALLAALETAEPGEGASRSSRRSEREEAEGLRVLPALLEARTPAEPEPEEPRREMRPVLRAREGEQVLRSLGSSVVLRRRRA